MPTIFLQGASAAFSSPPMMSRFESLPETHVRPEKCRRGEIEDTPDFAESVFHGGSGKREAMLCVHALNGARGERAVVFDILRLVENVAEKRRVEVVLDVYAHQVVRCDDDVDAFFAARRSAFPFRSDDWLYANRRSEAGELVCPIEHERCGAYDEHGRRCF